MTNTQYAEILALLERIADSCDRAERRALDPAGAANAAAEQAAFGDAEGDESPPCPALPYQPAAPIAVGTGRGKRGGRK